MQKFQPTGPALRGISSMATRLLLAELLDSYARHSGVAVDMESVGGVDAARRVQAGEAFDLVVLASDAMDKLIAAGCIDPGSKVDLAHSGVAVAVPATAALPDLRDEAAVRAAVLAAPSISYSTGPSGIALVKLFARWGITEAIQSRMVQAPPGVPVGALIARGEVALGFQQLSELIHVQGITVVGPLPAAIQITTTFSAGMAIATTRTAEVGSLLQYLSGPAAADAKRRQGMEPA